MLPFREGHMVKCIKADGDLVEGDLYTIKRITENGNILLWEVNPPEGYTSFRSDRFENYESILEEYYDSFVEQLSNKAGFLFGVH